jgi:dephospho-CoA kinase
MLVGVTGSIGSGKSSVAKLLGKYLSARVFSADEICRQMLEVDQPAYLELVKRWGTKFLGADKKVDRSLLREQVFLDLNIRESLESILHPMVRTRLLEEKLSTPAQCFLVAEVPLLYESGWENDFDGIVCVACDTSHVIDRVKQRDKVSADEVEKIITSQMLASKKKKRADWVIDNNGWFSETEVQVTALAETLKKKFCHRGSSQ